MVAPVGVGPRAWRPCRKHPATACPRHRGPAPTPREHCPADLGARPLPGPGDGVIIVRMGPDAVPVRVLIADDHPVVRRGMRRCWPPWTGIEVVGEADERRARRSGGPADPAGRRGDGPADALDGRRGGHPAAGRTVPDAAVLVLTMFEDDETVLSRDARRRPRLPAQGRRAGGDPGRDPGRGGRPAGGRAGVAARLIEHLTEPVATARPLPGADRPGAGDPRPDRPRAAPTPRSRPGWTWPRRPSATTSRRSSPSCGWPPAARRWSRPRGRAGPRLPARPGYADRPVLRRPWPQPAAPADRCGTAVCSGWPRRRRPSSRDDLGARRRSRFRRGRGGRVRTRSGPAAWSFSAGGALLLAVPLLRPRHRGRSRSVGRAVAVAARAPAAGCCGWSGTGAGPSCSGAGRAVVVAGAGLLVPSSLGAGPARTVARGIGGRSPRSSSPAGCSSS